MSPSWPRVLKLHELGAGPLRINLEASADDREAIGRQLGLESLAALTAEIAASPWFDGVEITGSFRADVEQICGVTLEPFCIRLVAAKLLIEIITRGAKFINDAPRSGSVAITWAMENCWSPSLI